MVDISGGHLYTDKGGTTASPTKSEIWFYSSLYRIKRFNFVIHSLNILPG